MTLWTIGSAENHDLYTVVYLLSDALRSALSDAYYLEGAARPTADVKGAGHAEIAARLGRFRDSCKIFQEREALLLTKLLRARKWAIELRRLAADLQPEIDQFIEATDLCEEVKGEFVKDAQRMFHGGTSLWRFLDQRKPETSEISADTARWAVPEGCYLVGGRIALFELRAACEIFFEQINDEFFSSGDEERPSLAQPLMSYLELSADDNKQPAQEPHH